MQRINECRELERASFRKRFTVFIASYRDVGMRVQPNPTEFASRWFHEIEEFD